MNDDQTKLNPYRKVSTGTWADRKVDRLSKLAPSGQAMFLMLLVGPQTTNMPGVQPVGRMAFAELLDWEVEAFDEAFAEVSAQGLAKADWKARFVFVPKAIQHNLPQSPNVVKSWASTWLRVPDCELKREAWKTIYLALSAMGESFAAAFEAACPLDLEEDERGVLDAFDSFRKALPKASPKTSPNQEQEQDKEQDKEQNKSKGGAGAPGIPEIPLGHPAGAGQADCQPAGPKDKGGTGKAKEKRTLTAQDLVALGVAPKHAQDWLTARTAKKPLTETALDGVRREATKAGYSLPDAIKICAEKGWIGFDATWVPRRPAPRTANEKGAKDVVTPI